MVCAYGSFCYRRLTERALFCYYKSSRSSGIFACSLHFVYIESERSTTDRKDPCLLDQAIATVVVIVQMTMAILGQAMQGAVRHVMALAIYAVVKHQCAYCNPAVNTLLTFLAAGNVSQQGLRNTKSSFQVQLLTILRCGIEILYCLYFSITFPVNNYSDIYSVMLTKEKQSYRSSRSTQQFLFCPHIRGIQAVIVCTRRRVYYIPCGAFYGMLSVGGQSVPDARKYHCDYYPKSGWWLLRLVVCSVLYGIPDTLSAPATYLLQELFLLYVHQGYVLFVATLVPLRRCTRGHSPFFFITLFNHTKCSERASLHRNNMVYYQYHLLETSQVIHVMILTTTNRRK